MKIGDRVQVVTHTEDRTLTADGEIWRPSSLEGHWDVKLDNGVTLNRVSEGRMVRSIAPK